MSDEKNYRAYCYFRAIGLGPAEATRIDSARLPLQHAVDLLSVLSTSGDYLGGGIEHHLPGLGWVICEDETECPDQDEDD